MGAPSTQEGVTLLLDANGSAFSLVTLPSSCRPRHFGMRERAAEMPKEAGLLNLIPRIRTGKLKKVVLSRSAS